MNIAGTIKNIYIMISTHIKTSRNFHPYTQSTFKYHHNFKHDTKLHKFFLSKKNIEFSHHCKWTTKYKYFFLCNIISIANAMLYGCDYMSQVLALSIHTRNLFSCHNKTYSSWGNLYLYDVRYTLHCFLIILLYNNHILLNIIEQNTT